MDLDIEVMLAAILAKNPKSMMVSNGLSKRIRDHLKIDVQTKSTIFCHGELICEILIDRMLSDSHVIIELQDGTQKMLETKKFVKK